MSDKREGKGLYVNPMNGKFLTFRLVWTIENFESNNGTYGEIIQSPIFPSERGLKSQWYIQLRPVKLDQSNTAEYSIILKKTPPVDSYIKAQISLETPVGAQFSLVCNSLVYLTTEHSEVHWRVSGKRLHDELLWDKNPSKTVILKCRIRVLSTVRDSLREDKADTLESEKLRGHMTSFLNDTYFKDFTFVVQGQKFFVHKTILALRSPVFATIFKRKMNDKVTSKAVVTDIKPEIFQKMINFIYTDKVDCFEESAAELLVAAEKYNLHNLKSICINFLSEDLSAENVLEALELAELYSSKELKKAALNFLVRNSEIMETKEFGNTMGSHPHLIVELFKLQKENKLK